MATKLVLSKASTACSTLPKDSLEMKRKVIDRLIVEGFPYTKRYLGAGLRNHFSHNRCQRHHETDSQPHQRRARHHLPEGHATAVRLLDHVRARMIEFQEATGNMYNLEATQRRAPPIGLRKKTASGTQKSYKLVPIPTRTTRTPHSCPLDSRTTRLRHLIAKTSCRRSTPAIRN